MTRDEWTAAWNTLPPGDLRDRIGAAGVAEMNRQGDNWRGSSEFRVWMTLEEAAASGVQELVGEAVDGIENVFSET